MKRFVVSLFVMLASIGGLEASLKYGFNPTQYSQVSSWCNDQLNYIRSDLSSLLDGNSDALNNFNNNLSDYQFVCNNYSANDMYILLYALDESDATNNANVLHSHAYNFRANVANLMQNWNYVWTLNPTQSQIDTVTYAASKRMPLLPS